jgi:hypothetical protein
MKMTAKTILLKPKKQRTHSEMQQELVTMQVSLAACEVTHIQTTTMGNTVLRLLLHPQGGGWPSCSMHHKIEFIVSCGFPLEAGFCLTGQMRKDKEEKKKKCSPCPWGRCSKLQTMNRRPALRMTVFKEQNNILKWI